VKDLALLCQWERWPQADFFQASPHDVVQHVRRRVNLYCLLKTFKIHCLTLPGPDPIEEYHTSNICRNSSPSRRALGVFVELPILHFFFAQMDRRNKAKQKVEKCLNCSPTSAWRVTGVTQRFYLSYSPSRGSAPAVFDVLKALASRHEGNGTILK